MEKIWASAVGAMIGFALYVLSAALAAALVRAYRRWRIKRRIEADLQYVAPELREQVRAERYAAAGLPGYAAGLPWPQAGTTAFHACPRCGTVLLVNVMGPPCPRGPDPCNEGGQYPAVGDVPEDFQ